MTSSAALAADLHTLSVTLDATDIDIDIDHTFTQLNAAAAAGVSSYLGLCVTVTGGAAAVQLNTVAPGGGAVGSSVRIPVPTVGDAQLPVVNIVLYAATPGAFTDLAADLAWMTGNDHTEFRLDQDLTAPADAAAPSALALTSLINQAIGVLISRGRTPEQSAQDLATLAAHDHADLPAAAASVLATVDAPLLTGDRRQRRSSRFRLFPDA